MKIRTSFLLVLAVVAGLCGPQTVRASILNDYIVLSIYNGAIQYGNGGEFQATIYGSYADATSGSNSVASFYTFCADTTLNFYPGSIYHITGEAPENGLMTQFGKWLFYQYWTNGDPVAPGSLTGYVPGHAALAANATFGSLSNVQVAGAMQAEIWTSLGMALPSGYNFAGLKTTAEGIFGWVPTATGQSFGAVDELTLTPTLSNGQDNSGETQSQLYVPDITQGVFIVPEPATIIIWSLLGLGSWLGMRVWRRRRGGPAGRQPWSNENRTAIRGIIVRGAPR